VIIAVSSTHRASALAAVAWAIDELKAVVPIFKREWYEDGSEWKGNCESCVRSTHRASHPSHQPHTHHDKYRAQDHQHSPSCSTATP